jgi:hypothetical protein
MRRSGWLTFSAVVLIIAGIMRVLDAIWAFRYNGTIVDNLHDAIFGHSLTTYGWIWLIVGAILIAAGLLVLSPSARLSAEVARWIGIIAAAVGAITAISWMPYYPVWSLAYIAIAVMVIYGLSAHFGHEATTSGPSPRR